MEDKIHSVIDRYIIEILPTLKINTQKSYLHAIEILRQFFGHYSPSEITPQLAYKHLEEIAKARTMNVANSCHTVLLNIMDRSVR